MELRAYGKTVMLAYGGGSIKKNGVYDRITTLLREAGIAYLDYGGQTRVRAQQQTEWRFQGLNGLDHQPRPLVRVPRLGSVGLIILNPSRSRRLPVIADSGHTGQRLRRAIRRMPGVCLTPISGGP